MQNLHLFRVKTSAGTALGCGTKAACDLLADCESCSTDNCNSSAMGFGLGAKHLVVLALLQALLLMVM